MGSNVHILSQGLWLHATEYHSVVRRNDPCIHTTTGVDFKEITLLQKAKPRSFHCVWFRLCSIREMTKLQIWLLGVRHSGRGGRARVGLQEDGRRDPRGDGTVCIWQRFKKVWREGVENVYGSYFWETLNRASWLQLPGLAAGAGTHMRAGVAVFWLRSTPRDGKQGHPGFSKWGSQGWRETAISIYCY